LKLSNWQPPRRLLPWNSMNKYLLIPLVLFLGLVVAIIMVMSRGRDPHEIPSPLINKPAPAFQLPQLHDPSKTISAADMRGKVYVLNFWGSWCIACRDEHPLLVQYARQNVVPIYGVDINTRMTALTSKRRPNNS